MTRIFLTGATGVLGRRVVPALVTAGHEVTGVARSDAKAAELRALGATPVAVDLFDASSVLAAVDGHEAVAHLATNIPTGASASLKRGWKTNDRLRTTAAANLARAAIETGAGRYIQESITFPYVDRGDEWIDETTECTYFWGNASCAEAERAADAVTDAGGNGVVLRFAMFMADDSAHLHTLASLAGKGIWGLFGEDDAYTSFIHVDDAAAAVVAALDVPAGKYNVAEPDPGRRADHRLALAEAVGRADLRSLPAVMEKASGAAGASLARSQRITSAKLQATSEWQPTRPAVLAWKDLT